MFLEKPVEFRWVAGDQATRSFTPHATTAMAAMMHAANKAFSRADRRILNAFFGHPIEVVCDSMTYAQRVLTIVFSNAGSSPTPLSRVAAVQVGDA
jgi:hypothetical protein